MHISSRLEPARNQDATDLKDDRVGNINGQTGRPIRPRSGGWLAMRSHSPLICPESPHHSWITTTPGALPRAASAT